MQNFVEHENHPCSQPDFNESVDFTHVGFGLAKAVGKTLSRCAGC